MGDLVGTDEWDRIPVRIEHTQFVVFDILALVEQLQLGLENAGDMGLLQHRMGGNHLMSVGREGQQQKQG